MAACGREYIFPQVGRHCRERLHHPPNIARINVNGSGGGSSDDSDDGDTLQH